MPGRPYFLPCAVTACISAAALCSACFFVSETLPRLASKQAGYTRLGGAPEDEGSLGSRQAASPVRRSLELGSFGVQEPFGAAPIAGGFESGGLCDTDFDGAWDCSCLPWLVMLVCCIRSSVQ